MQSDSLSSEDEFLAAIALALTQKERRHKLWVREAYVNKENGNYSFITELSMGDRETHFRYIWMTRNRF